ncbi:O-succinylhomoserine sulfhydrylase [Gammaproteobacteria bacterium]|nr:O-succinylhomoserine sulfhydrylase [Gammaproteobacteria bacterium]
MESLVTRDNPPSSSSWRPATRAVRSGQRRGSEREHADPLYLTSSFVFDQAEAAAGHFRDGEEGNIYSRFTNPTVESFERRLASMEGGEWGFATASGMAAITLLALTFLKAGDRVVLGRNLFGSTLTLFSKTFARFGVDVAIVDGSAPQDWSRVLASGAAMVFAESPSNPLGEVVDIADLSRQCAEIEALLVIDNCLLTPVLQRPLELGADIVMHSATKMIDGQGRCLGGVLCGRDPQQREALMTMQRSAGFTLSAFNAWVFHNGLQTLPIRVAQQSANAGRVAEWLAKQPDVECVHYTGLPSHPDHNLACQQQSGFGQVLSFAVAGGERSAWRLIDATEWLSITGNLGDARTTITHPASTTHGRLSDADRARMGIGSNLIRLSVGLEDPDDVIDELARGLAAIASVAGA